MLKQEAKFVKRSKGVPALQLNEYAMQDFTFKDTKKQTRTLNYTTTHFQIISLASLHRQALQPRITHIRLGEVIEVDL